MASGSVDQQDVINQPVVQVEPPGPFVLRTLLHDVPLAEDGGEHNIKINCVEYLDGNLYIGTSASELLHFVQIPSDPNDANQDPTYILASRLKPTYAESSLTGEFKPGVQQILLLPRIGKACILCNSTVTFYSLPELSPVFGTVRVKNCLEIGGLDLNEDANSNGAPAQGQSILLSLSRKIQVVRVGNDARAIKDIVFAGSTILSRRDTIACVADSTSYALLDVERQLKIPLMSISSLAESQPDIGKTQNIAGNPGDGLIRSVSSANTRPDQLKASDGHGRSTSLGNFISRGTRRGSHVPDVDAQVLSVAGSPQRSLSPATPNNERNTSQEDPAREKPLPQPPFRGHHATKSSIALPQPIPILKPHIASPTSDEFLLVTGTTPQDPGIGIFVNLDGDPTRPTLEFSTYPAAIVVDGGPTALISSRTSLSDDAEDGYVIASTTKHIHGSNRAGLEIQRWDIDAGNEGPVKYWLEKPYRTPRDDIPASPLGLRPLLGSQESYLTEVVDCLCQQRFSAFSRAAMQLSLIPSADADADALTASSMERVSKEKELFDEGSPLPEGWEAARVIEEQAFARRFAKTTSRIAVWADDQVWWASRNPLILQLDGAIEATIVADFSNIGVPGQRRQLFTLLGSIRGREPKTELEFMTFSYIRQKAGLLLFMSLLNSRDGSFSEGERRALEEVILDGNIDPRVILALMPALQNEIIENRKGMWIFGGVKKSADTYMVSQVFSRSGSTLGESQQPVLVFLASYLTTCRRKKGLASNSSEAEVFRTVDACLLLILLELDKGTASGPVRAGGIRAELYELVDRGVDCFDRAVDLLEAHHRLYVLSRLYQSRKQASDVLATWKRIIEGERNDGGEFKDGEQGVREYLSRLKNKALVQEYGLWLANRNPKLGVQVFADDRGNTPKFEPAQVVQLLREEAPDAVKYYLEYLVFGKGHTNHVNELINYYLDVVMADLASSQAARNAVSTTYQAYRALHPPKPTYRQFLQENSAPDNEAWQSRLRLLQLLGEAHNYDTKAIRERIQAGVPGVEGEEGMREYLVPEAIILDGREGLHEKALRLLVQQLGDYDTAVSYCLRGGSSIYAPSIYSASAPAPPSSDAASQTPATVAPDMEESQSRLFKALLIEFLSLPDDDDRLEQTSALLERFGGWFDIIEVLEQIPNGWSVDVVSSFLVTALRKLVSERRESAVASKLSSAENLKINVELLDKLDEKGPVVDGGADESAQQE